MYIGVDYGKKRVGVAISDESGKLAFPFEVVQQPHAFARICALAKERQAVKIVMGDSKNFKNEDNTIMDSVRTFAEKLQTETQVPVVFQPEFMTSVQASREVGKEKLDAAAAALILQSFLDTMNNHGKN